MPTYAKNGSSGDAAARFVPTPLIPPTGCTTFTVRGALVV
jgi:hypothetical protein